MKGYSRKVGLVLCLLVLSAISGTASASRLYVIVVANTNDPAARRAITAGRDVAINWLQFFQANLKSDDNQTDSYPVSSYILDGDKFTTEDLRSVVNAKLTSVTSDDAIFFYYIGHGENIPNSRYPRLLIPNSSGGGAGLSFERITSVLQSKGAGLLFAVAEACNSYPEPAEDSSPSLASFHSKIVDLFFRSKMDVIVSTASPGEYAHASPVNGGVYSAILFAAIRKELQDAQTERRPANWDNIIRRADRPISVGGEQQTPQFWIYK